MLGQDVPLVKRPGKRMGKALVQDLGVRGAERLKGEKEGLACKLPEGLVPGLSTQFPSRVPHQVDPQGYAGKQLSLSQFP